MPFSKLTELALRAAINTDQNLLLDGCPDRIKDSAIQRGLELLKGHSTVSDLTSKTSAQSEIIGTALTVVIDGYKVVKEQMAVLEDKRVAFDKERKSNVASFMVPEDMEFRDLSQSQKTVFDFIEHTQAASFSKYLGIQSAPLEGKRATFYSVLPFYDMSKKIRQPVASNRLLDKQRISISLFFRSALFEAIHDIDLDFQQDCKFVQFWKSAFQRGNYLNHRRAPRLIMMTLANLLWNLQHPVDPKTGFPLSLDQCIGLCRDVESFLNNLLNPDMPPYLDKINSEKIPIISFVRKVEVHVKSLRAAYAEEQLHALNIADVTNSAHHLLRVMNKSILKLLYKRYNPIAKKAEPDRHAAENISYYISFMNQLMIRNDKLVAPFQKFAHFVPKKSLINTPPATVIDILILFCHLPWPERHRLLKELDHCGSDEFLEMAAMLRKLDKHYMKPIRTNIKAELKKNKFSTKPANVAEITAQYLVPIFTLIIEDYRIDVDTHKTYDDARSSQQAPLLSQKLCGKNQVQAINQMAALSGENYYRWALSPFIKLRKDTEAELDKLPQYQYRLTQVTELLDSIRDIVEHYRGFLQDERFQKFLKTCLNKIKHEYDVLEAHIKKVDRCLSKDEVMSRNMQAILPPMMLDLNGSLDALLLATSNFERTITAPDFLDKQRQELNDKLSAIDELYRNLFDENSNINLQPVDFQKQEFLQSSDTSSNSVEITAPIQEEVPTRQILQLRELVRSCYEGLSYQSYHGKKGEMLKNLLTSIDHEALWTSSRVNGYVKELIHIVASYRPTWFGLFQAPYGQTRSAKVLIEAVLDLQVNLALPLTPIIFGPSYHCEKLTADDVIDKLKAMQQNKGWEESIDQFPLAAAV